MWNARDSEEKTLLCSSARNAANASKTWEMYLGLELLIEKGADANVKDHPEETLLHVVARQVDEKNASAIWELLISNGAKVNEEDSEGPNPVGWCKDP